MNLIKKLVIYSSIVVILICCLFFIKYNLNNDVNKVNYVFSGNEKNRSGYAEGTIYIHSDKKSKLNYYVLYWANDKQILDNYEEIAVIEKSKNDNVVYKIPENVVIPQGATQLVVFETNEIEKKYDKNKSAIHNLSLKNKYTSFSIPKNKRYNLNNLLAKNASLSDVHVVYENGFNKLKNALNFLESQNVQTVFISGDHTGDGSEYDFESYRKAVESSNFTGDIYSCLGNHDSNGDRQNFRNSNGYHGKDKTWNNNIDYPDSNLTYYSVIKDNNVYLFLDPETIGINYPDISNSDLFSDKQLDWLESQLEKYSGEHKISNEFKYKRYNIFIYEHIYFYNYGPGDILDGSYLLTLKTTPDFPNNLRLKKILEKYKEVIFVTGHSHLVFDENVNFSDNENGIDVARMIHNSSVELPRYYSSSKDRLYESTNIDDSQGYIFSIYEDEIIYCGVNLYDGNFIPSACYIMPTMVINRN